MKLFHLIPKQINQRVVILFFISVILKQLVWVALIPLWQFPDEQAHFAQVQNSAEQIRVGKNSTSEEIVSTERYLGTYRDWKGTNRFTFNPQYKYEYSNTDQGIYEDVIRKLPKSTRKNLIINEATSYPPLYYQLGSFTYRLFYNSDLITRVFAVRVENIIFYVFFIYICYQSTKILFPDKFNLQVSLLILIAYHPMLSFMFSGVNSDSFFILLFTLGMYCSLYVLKYGTDVKNLLIMFFALIFALYTKPQGHLLSIIYVFPLGYAIYKTKTKKWILFLFIITLLIGGGYAFWMLITNQQILPDVGSLSSLLNNDYHVSIISHLKNTLVHTYREVLPWYWGVFRWLSLTYPRIIHRIINLTLLIGIIGFIWAFMSKKNVTGPEKKLQLFLLYCTFVYFAGITLFDYLFIKTHNFSIGIQGRYFFPVIFSHLFILFAGLRYHLRNISLNLIFIPLCMICLHLFASYYVIGSYYDLGSIRTFFLQASQYKPLFFKMPFLIAILISSCSANIVFLWYYVRNFQKL